jgi:hypothetical protein
MHHTERPDWMTRLRPYHFAPLLLLSFFCWACPVVVAGAAAGGAAGTAVSAKESQTEQHGVLTYVGTVLVDIVYFPAKVVFAGVGATTAGVAYVLTLGDSSVSDSIWNASVEGNYIITPNRLTGKEPVRFVGP